MSCDFVVWYAKVDLFLQWFCVNTCDVFISFMRHASIKRRDCITQFRVLHLE